MISLLAFKNPKLFPLWVTLSVGMVVVLGHFKVFPIASFIATVFFLLFIFWALRNPRAVFSVFLATIVLEHIPLMSVGGIDFRWYQVVAVSLGIGLLIRFLRGKEDIRSYFLSFKWYDIAIAGLFIVSILSALMKGGVAMKQSIVLLSFVVLYFLVRYFIRSRKEILQSVPFLAGSFFVVSIYGIAQNVLFLSGEFSGQVMAGRPNATFTEADWLGVYAGVSVVFYSVLTLSSLMFLHKGSRRYGASRILSYEMLILAWVILILTVARSAWLATAIGMSVMGLVALYKQGFLGVVHWGRDIFITGVVAMFLVFGLHLTPFELGNRIQSVGTGLQEITIACQGGGDGAIPQMINRAEDLQLSKCKQINLEEIREYESRGYNVQKVFRKDPTIEIRKDIWVTALREIQQQPALGIGWGNIGSILGTDENGASLNSSNIFLEFWLGSGVLGFLGIMCIFGWALILGVRLSCSENKEEYIIGLAILGMGIVFLVANLFNAGHFLAIFWVWLAIAFSYSFKTKPKEI